MTDQTHLVDHITGHRRMRRIRKADWTRRMVRENQLTVDDLIWPIFLVAGSGISEPIPAMHAKPPDIQRSTLCEKTDHANRPTLKGLRTLAAWKTARQLRLTMRMRRRYSTPTRPPVSS